MEPQDCGGGNLKEFLHKEISGRIPYCTILTINIVPCGNRLPLFLAITLTKFPPALCTRPFQRFRHGVRYSKEIILYSKQYPLFSVVPLLILHYYIQPLAMVSLISGTCWLLKHDLLQPVCSWLCHTFSKPYLTP